MASYTGGGTSGPDYVQPGEPADPDPLETWYDTDADPDGDGTEQGEYLIYGTDGSWHSTTVQSHRALRDVVEDAHHNPVSVEGPLRLSSGQVLDLAASDGLTLDADGKLRVAASSVTESMLAVDVATQDALNSHTSDTSNPHNVSDDQTGAADALNSHESDTSNPHNVSDDQTGAADALNSHAQASNAHHSQTTEAADLSDVSADSDPYAHHKPPQEEGGAPAREYAGDYGYGAILVPFFRNNADGTVEMGLYNLDADEVASDTESLPTDLAENRLLGVTASNDQVVLDQFSVTHE